MKLHVISMKIQILRHLNSSFKQQQFPPLLSVLLLTERLLLCNQLQNSQSSLRGREEGPLLWKAINLNKALPFNW